MVVAGACCDHRPHQRGVVDDEIDDDGLVGNGSGSSDGGFEGVFVVAAQGCADECLGEKDEGGSSASSGSREHLTRCSGCPWPGDPRVNIQRGKSGEATPYQVKQVLAAIKKMEEQS